MYRATGVCRPSVVGDPETDQSCAFYTYDEDTGRVLTWIVVSVLRSRT